MNKIVKVLFGFVASLAATLTLGAAVNPADYELVEYIESTGTQWIDTGIMPTATDVIEVRCSSSVGDKTVIGAQSDADHRIQIFQSSNKKAYYRACASTSYGGSVDWPLGVVIDLKLDLSSSVFVANGTSLAVTKGANVPTISYGLFANNAGTAATLLTGRIYACRIVNDGKTHDFYPCKTKDGGRPGFLEVTDNALFEFFENQGTGDDFTAGPVASDVRVAANGIEYKVTLTAGAGGTVSPSGETWVATGGTLDIAATPSADGEFGYWLGLSGDLGNPMQTLTVTGPVSAKAVFDKTVCIARNGKDTAEGTEEDPLSLTVAMKIAELAAVTVKAAPGTYDVAREIKLSVGSSFVGAGPSETVFARKTDSGNHRIFYLDHEDASVSALTISGGRPPEWVWAYGAGAYISENGGTISNCVFRDNYLDGHHGTGGGVVCYGAKGVVTHCVFSNNTTSVYDDNAAGVAASIQKGRIDNCLILGHTDTSSNFGGILVVGTGGVAENCTIVKNTAKACAGVYASAGAQVRNCVIANNSTKGATASAAVWAKTASAFANCISDDHAPNENCRSGDGLTFADAEHGDWHLAGGSLAVDVGGTVDSPSTTDLDGNNRYSGALDAGCYEFDNSKFAVGVTADVASGFLPLTVVLTATVTGAEASDEIELSWDIGNDGTVEHLGEELAWQHVQETPGTFDVAVTALNKTTGKSVTSVSKSVFTAAPRTLYVVARNAGAARPYATWATAAADVQTAVDYALAGAEIVVSNGTYLLDNQVLCEKEIVIRGLTGRPEDVVLDAQQKSRVMEINAGAGAELHSLTLQNGKVNGNVAGLYVHGKGASVVSNCIVRSCSNPGNAKFNYGGGVYDDTPGSLLTHLVVSNCTTSTGYGDGGAVDAVAVQLGDTARLEHSLIVDNRATGGWSTSSVLVNNGSVRFCTIGKNRARSFGGVNVTGTGTVEYNVIAGNTSVYTNTPRARVWGAATAYDGNDATHYNATDTKAEQAATIARLKGNVSDAWLINDSCFRQEEKDIFRRVGRWDLGPHSSARNLVSPGDLDFALPASDLKGNPRRYGAAVDAGCYESLIGGLMLEIR